MGIGPGRTETTLESLFKDPPVPESVQQTEKAPEAIFEGPEGVEIRVAIPEPGERGVLTAARALRAAWRAGYRAGMEREAKDSCPYGLGQGVIQAYRHYWCWGWDEGHNDREGVCETVNR